MIIPITERFWKRVVKMQSGCWHWTGQRVGGRYGRLRINQSKRVLAHRLSWEIHNGVIPEGSRVLHACDNPPCVNPAHLFLGTIKDNSRDMVSKGRQYRPTGERNPKAVLCKESVREIRRELVRKVSQSVLAKRFGVSPKTIHGISKGTKWKHLS